MMMINKDVISFYADIISLTRVTSNSILPSFVWKSFGNEMRIERL